MAQIGLTFSVEGDKEVVSMFDATGARASNLRRPMDAIGEYMLDEIDTNYSTRGGTWGRWRRRKKAYPHPLLEATRKMRSSFWKRSNRESVTVGNSDRKFKYHQSKAPRSSNLPRRVMIAIAEQQRREAVRMLQRHIMEK